MRANIEYFQTKTKEARKAIVQNVIWLKTDLKISDRCERLLSHLKTSLSDQGPFAPHFRAYFNLHPLVLPFVISDHEPSEVIVLKKIFNTLNHVQIAFRLIEDMDVREENSLLTIALKANPVIQKAVNELYAAIQMVDASGEDIQLILGPHLEILRTQLLALSTKLDEASITEPTDSLAKLLAEGVGTLSIEEVKPEHRESTGLQSLSHLICNLPSQMAKLLKHAQLEQEHVSASTESSKLEAHIAAQREALQQNFENLLMASGWFSNKYHFLGLIRSLAKHSSDILSVLIPGTKEASLKAETLLNTLRHSVIPKVIAEVEHFEETLALKPGTLSNSFKQHINDYYTQLASLLLNVVKGASALDRAPEESLSLKAGYAIAKHWFHFSPTVGDPLVLSPQMNLMQDDVFLKSLYEQRITRLMRTQCDIKELQARIQQEADLDRQRKTQREAVLAFFNQLKSLRWWAHLWQFEHIEPSTKLTLMQYYQQFKDEVRAAYPELNAIILMAFDPSQLTSTELTIFSQTKSPNAFQQVMNYQRAVLSLFNPKSFNRQALASATLHMESILQGALAHQLSCLNEKKAPFEPVTLCTEEGQTAAHYQMNQAHLCVQRRHLEKAESDLRTFLNLADAHMQHLKPGFPELKEMAECYATLQPFVRSLEQANDVPEGYADELGRAVKNGFLTREKLIPLILNLEKQLKTLQKTTQENEAWSKTQEDLAKERAPVPLPPQETLEPKPLLQRLKDLNLSSSIKQLMDHQLVPFLKNSLDRSVFLQLNLTKIVTEFHVLSPEVILYQKLINAMLRLKNSLRHLEQMKESGVARAADDVYSDLLPTVYHQLRYVMNIVVPLLTAIFYAMFYLQEASSNPGLKMILNQAKEIMKPLQNLPLVGKKMAEIEHAPEQTYDASVNMVELWEAQQQLVTQTLSGKPVLQKVPIASSVKTTVLPENRLQTTGNPQVATRLDSKTIRQFAKHLFDIPQKLKALNNDETTPIALTHAQIDAFVENLEQFNWDAGYPTEDSFKVMLNAVISINEQLALGGKEARHLVLHQVENIGRMLVSISNNTEFQIGFKLGELTSKTLLTFNAFYRTLIEQFPVSKKDHPDDTAQDKQVLISDTFMTKTCLKNERARRYMLAANNTHQKIHQALFEDTSGYFVKFTAMAQSKKPYFGFEACEVKLEFLNNYHKIQPFLRQIDLKYDKMLFLRLLRTPDDFATELTRILALEPELHRLVEARKKEKIDKIARCDARIKQLKELAIAESMRSTGLNLHFKDKVFDTCWTTHHRQALSLELHRDLSLYANRFLSLLDASVQSNKKHLIRSIPMTRCWVEKISNREPTSAEKASVEFHYRKNIKNEILIIQNGANYAIGFCNEEGKYEQKTIDIGAADLGFLRSYQSGSSISKVHADTLNRALRALGSEVTLMPCVKTTIMQKMHETLPALQKDLEPLRLAYRDLSTSLKTIDALLTQHQAKVQKNAIYHELMKALLGARQRCIDPMLFKEGITPLQVERLYAPIKTLLSQIEHYQLMMEIYNHLDEMILHMKHENSYPQKDARIALLRKLQKLMTNQSVSIDDRLKALAKCANSQVSLEILQPHPIDSSWLHQAWRWLKHQLKRILAIFGLALKPSFDEMFCFFKSKIESSRRPSAPQYFLDKT